MQAKIKRILLVVMLLCWALVSCKGPDSCDLQMMAGGAQYCQDARK